MQPHKEDNYHPEDRYEEHRPGADGFAQFHDPENDQWYFAYYHKDELVLRSQGYQTEAARDAVHDTSAEKLSRKDDYLACKEYEDRPRSEQHPEFTVFEENNEYYFALVDKDGKLLLRGEGYKTEAARAKGIEAVIKNKGDEKRYKIEENLGYHFVVLRSANNREIARSCPKTLGGAEALIALLIAPPIPLAGATPVPEVDPERGSSNWWIWALAILALIVLFFLWRSCNDAPTI